MYQEKNEQNAIQAKKPEANKTGIPDRMKTAVQQYSQVPLDDVRVHYNSSSPRGLGALAYTQGNQVYIGPGQEQHLAHELGHVVQQKLGRVSATAEVHGQPLNDSPQLEQDADLYRRFY